LENVMWDMIFIFSALAHRSELTFLRTLYEKWRFRRDHHMAGEIRKFVLDLKPTENWRIIDFMEETWSPNGTEMRYGSDACRRDLNGCIHFLTKQWRYPLWNVSQKVNKPTFVKSRDFLKISSVKTTSEFCQVTIEQLWLISFLSWRKRFCLLNAFQCNYE
jgi:hypothetical protein